MSRLLLALLVSLAALAIAGIPGASVASANGLCTGNDCVTIVATSSAPSVAKGHSVDLTFTLTVIDPLITATFTETQTDGFSADPTTVELDGAPATAVTAGNGFTTDLAGLTAGTHTVTVTSTALADASTATPDFTASASVAFTFVDGPGLSSGQVVVHGVGGNWALSFLEPADPTQVPSNYGYSVSFGVSHQSGVDGDSGELVIELPGGLDPSTGAVFKVNEDGTLGTQETCHAGGSPTELVCTISPVTVGDGVPYAFLVASDDSQVPGTHADVQFHIRPAGVLDPSPAEADATTHILFVGSPDVQYTLTPDSKTQITVGETKTFDLAITNDGTDASPDSHVVIVLEPPSDGQGAPFSPTITGDGIFGGGGSTLWHGSLAPGQTKHVTIKIKANVAGRTGTLSVLDETYSVSPECFGDPTCDVVAQVDLLSAAKGTVILDPFFHPHVAQLTDGNGNTLKANPALSRGGVMHVHLEGFKAHTKVTVTLHSTTRTLGTVTADANGKVDYLFTVPADLELGGHSLTFSGSPGDPVTVNFTVAETLASTGVMPREALWFGLGSLGLGVGLVLASRRRRRVLRDETLS
jgi:hypothetical protein